MAQQIRIAFLSNQLSERGSEVALYDYATYNELALANQSIILYGRDAAGNVAEVRNRFSERFDVFGYGSRDEIDEILLSQKCDALYVIKNGTRDGLISKVIPTMVHAVFPTSPAEVHGTSFAFVSRWLSGYSTNNIVPFVPHIVSLPEHEGDLRVKLNIPAEAKVFGCYGGPTSFDIDFVAKRVIPSILRDTDDIYFLFMNINRFIDNERVLFLQRSIDPDFKAAFINTCTAMLHARYRGETFGLSCGEFSLRHKPVITYSDSNERAHLDILGDDAIRYRTASELIGILKFGNFTRSAYQTYMSNFNSDAVMEKFDRILVHPAIGGGIDTAFARLGISRWDGLKFRIRHLLGRLRRFLRGYFVRAYPGAMH